MSLGWFSRRVFECAAFALLLLGVEAAAARSAREELSAAEDLARQFATGRVVALHEAFSPELASARPLTQLENLQRQINERLGALRMVLAAYPVPAPPGASRSAAIPIEFQRGSMEIVLAWRGELAAGAVVAFAIRPPAPRPSISNAPARHPDRGRREEAPYVYRGQLREEPATIRRSGLAPLQGSLALPIDATEESPVPGIILLGERMAPSPDGEFGHLRPRRDIALGLASQGIATLRFPLRTLESRGWTLSDLQLEDAREALRLLHGHPAVDSSRLYLLGHEIGGITAARLASQASAVRGVILLGTPSRWGPEWELSRIERGASLTGMPDELELSRLRGDMNLLGQGRLPAHASWHHAPWTFWEDLRRHDATAALHEYEGRLLYLVPSGSHLRSQRDLERWRRLFHELPDATAKAFDAGYWFQPVPRGERDSPLSALGRGHVSLDVIDEIAAWVGITRR